MGPSEICISERNLSDKDKQKIWEDYLASERKKQIKKEVLEEIRSTGM